MNAEPQKEHGWLQKLIGEWTCESECSMGPDQPPSKFTGTESVRSLGGLWTIAEGKGDMPGGGAATMIMTLGYDPAKHRYLGTFVASMMTHLWIYEGALDAAAKVLTLDCEGPDMSTGKITKYQDIITFENDDRRVMTSRMLGENGAWRDVMTARYQRVRQAAANAA